MKRLLSLLTLGCFLTTSALAACSSEIKLMLHQDGADASTTFTDSAASPNTVTAVGNAQIDTDQSVFGGASGIYDGTGDYLTIPDAAWMDVGTGDFTVDFRVRFASLVSVNQWFVSRNSSNTFDFRYNTAVGLVVVLQSSSYLQAWSPVINTWYHVAFVRSGGNLFFFVDGVQQGASQAAGDNVSDTVQMIIAADSSGPGNALNGWLDELEITNTAKWTSNFTPPTSAYCGTAADQSGMFMVFE